MQADGKTLVAQGRSVRRYNLDGSLNTSFGNGGTASVDFSDPFIFLDYGVTAVTVQPDGKILVAGYTALPSRSSF
jgi:Domain of unknown function (DUF5122) beta-propeller